MLADREREIAEQEQSLVRMARELTERDASLARREQQIRERRAELEAKQALAEAKVRDVVVRSGVKEPFARPASGRKCATTAAQSRSHRRRSGDRGRADGVDSRDSSSG